MSSHHIPDIIEKPIIAPGKLDKFSCPVDLKAFYADLFTAFRSNKIQKFNDFLGRPEDKKKGRFFEGEVAFGEQVDQDKNLNRAAGMYEELFIWKQHDGFIEFEMVWTARTPGRYSKFGWFEIKVYLVNRFLQDKEFLFGNEKKVLQTGLWEFRNVIVYKNSLKIDFLDKIPIVKNSPSLQNIFYEYFYEKTIESDHLDVGFKDIKGIVMEVIDKHFKT